MRARGQDEVHFGFAEQAEAVRGGWLQGRYHSDEGETVAEFLSFNEVFEVNPFEVGVSYAAERRAFRERKKFVEGLVDVRELYDRAFISLSNGEMRRVLFARALLTGPKRLVLDNPFGGLDPFRRDMMRKVLAALADRGVEIVIEGGCVGDVESTGVGGSYVKEKGKDALSRSKPIVEMRNVNVSFGRRVLFKDFAWTIREGERWVLRGPNGSGKTTLLSLITGDSPLAYACDITVLGHRRGEEGKPLSEIRARIGLVSPEQQLYLGLAPDALLAAAFAKKPRLLLLDEPCYNQPQSVAKRLLGRIEAWLSAHPRAAAVCVAHRPAHVPVGFTHELVLGSLPTSHEKGTK